MVELISPTDLDFKIAEQALLNSGMKRSDSEALANIFVGLINKNLGLFTALLATFSISFILKI